MLTASCQCARCEKGGVSCRTPLLAEWNGKCRECKSSKKACEHTGAESPGKILDLGPDLPTSKRRRESSGDGQIRRPRKRTAPKSATLVEDSDAGATGAGVASAGGGRPDSPIAVDTPSPRAAPVAAPVRTFQSFGTSPIVGRVTSAPPSLPPPVTWPTRTTAELVSDFATATRRSLVAQRDVLNTLIGDAIRHERQAAQAVLDQGGTLGFDFVGFGEGPRPPLDKGKGRAIAAEASEDDDDSDEEESSDGDDEEGSDGDGAGASGKDESGDEGSGSDSEGSEESDE